MSIDRIIFAVAGLFIWMGLGLWGVTQNHLFLMIPAFVGLNMIQAAFTGFCPMAILLKKMGAQPGQAFD